MGSRWLIWGWLFYCKKNGWVDKYLVKRNSYQLLSAPVSIWLARTSRSWRKNKTFHILSPFPPFNTIKCSILHPAHPNPIQSIPIQSNPIHGMEWCYTCLNVSSFSSLQLLLSMLRLDILTKQGPLLRWSVCHVKPFIYAWGQPSHLTGVSLSLH